MFCLSGVAVSAAVVALFSCGAANQEANPGGDTGGLSVRQADRLGTTRYRHGAVINELWFPANDRLVSAGGLRYRAWNADTGSLTNGVVTPLHSRTSFDGQRRILIAEPLVNGVPTQSFRVVDLITDQEVSRWLRPEWTQSSALSRSGKFAVLGLGKLKHTASIVNGQTGREIDRIVRKLPRTNRAAYPIVALSPDDRILALAVRPDHLQFFELSDEGKIEARLAIIDDQAFHRFEFSPKPNEVLLIGSRRSSLWNLRSRQMLAEWDESDTNRVSDAVFADQGKIIVELADGVVRVRETQSGKELRRFSIHSAPESYRIALSPDQSVLAAGGYQQRIRLYDFATGTEIRFDPQAETIGPVESVAISDDGEWIASAEYNGEVSVWGRQNDWMRTATLDENVDVKLGYGTNAGPNFLTFLPGRAKLLSGRFASDKSLNVWDAASRQRDSQFAGNGMGYSGVATSRDGKVMASTKHNVGLRIWDSEGKLQHQIAAGSNALSLSPDGSIVAVGLLRPGPVRSNNGIPEPSLPVAAVELWDTQTGMLIRSLPDVTSESYGFYSVSFSHNGRYLAGIANDGLYVWNAATGKRIKRIAVPRPTAVETAWHAPNCAIAFSPIDNFIAIPTAEGEIVFIDVESEDDTPLATVKGHDGPVNSVAWRRDGEFLVSGGNDSTIVLWEVTR